MPIKEQPKGPDLNSFREMMQGAIEEFNHKSLALTEAYQKLKKEIARVNLELERKNQELSSTNKALDQASAFLNNVFQSMSNGLLVIDNNNSILKTNAFLDQLFAEDTRAWEGQLITAVPIPPPLKEVIAAARDTVKSPYEGTLRIFVNGQERWIEVTGSIVDNTEGRELLLLIRDVTEMKDLRQQLIQNESLAGLGQLAVTVAHEIRNPLGGIEGFAALLRRDLEGFRGPQ